MESLIFVFFLETAVMVVLPTALQVTFPFPSTLAISALEEDQVTEASAPEGSAVMESWTVSPFLALAKPVILMPVRVTSAAFTSISFVAFTPPASAVMVTLPAATPVTFPLSTVAIPVLEEDQEIPL